MLIDKEKCVVVSTMEDLMTPTSYVSTLRSRVNNDGTHHGLQTHDFHALMQQMLPCAQRNNHATGLRKVVIRLSKIIIRICSKITNPNLQKELEGKVAVALCLLEKEFAPTYFDPMTHLVIHLVKECGLVTPEEDVLA